MIKIVRKILCAGPERDLLTDASLLLTRLVFGLSMALAHGQRKVPPSEGFVGAVEGMGLGESPTLPLLFLGGSYGSYNSLSEN